jgi:hypothetical protein
MPRYLSGPPPSIREQEIDVLRERSADEVGGAMVTLASRLGSLRPT